MFKYFITKYLFAKFIWKKKTVTQVSKHNYLYDYVALSLNYLESADQIVLPSPSLLFYWGNMLKFKTNYSLIIFGYWFKCSQCFSLTYRLQDYSN